MPRVRKEALLSSVMEEALSAAKSEDLLLLRIREKSRGGAMHSVSLLPRLRAGWE
jgi:hypothetical protein